MVRRVARRALLLGGAVGALGMAGYAAGGRNLFYAALTEDVAIRQISVEQAFAAAEAGQLLLIDIRRPEEWAASGSGVGAIRLDMRRGDFTERLLELARGRSDLPVALICARGVRSARLTNRLQAAGFQNVIDVPEGMFGSAAGPGWHAKGLPVDRS